MRRLSAVLLSLSLCCSFLSAPADAAARSLREGRAEITGNRIQIDERVFFEFDTHTLDRQSAPVLSDVARLLANNPDITRIEIQGHTDTQGDADYNRTLSQHRAEEVRRFLMQRGVGASRLIARGYGESQPLIAGDSEHAHRVNRRVEFIIIR